MGVDYIAVLAIGKEFESEDEIQDFLDDNNFEFSDHAKIYIEENSLYEFFEDRCDGGIVVELLDYYNGNHYYLGFPLSVHNVERFSEDVFEAIHKWDALFPNNPAEIIHTVKVH